MQGTVASYDTASGEGRLFTDAGVPLRFDHTALAEHLRFLRIGQRVHVELDDAGAVAGVRIW